ncbi:hypothetical protein [Thiorhodovibrio winogradskyi]|uniref:hypothetical protein n=1 Tax=Thiorhodovibrio winogradskyi TaxID=77007 RepID=UPI002E284120|nr:hypothetical protein [Thiorhodovibrio winogradskyi]
MLDVYQRQSAPEQAEIVAFWLEQQLLPPAEAQRRVDEVCFLVRAGSDALVGIGSLYPGELADNGQERRVLYYRSHLHPSARGHVRLAVGLLQAMRALLADPRLGRGGATAIAFETENPRLMSRAWRRLFTRQGWRRVGASACGRDLWISENIPGETPDRRPSSRMNHDC